MSLGRLLAAGKSLVGMPGGEGRYRVNKRVALPKFISPRNPFAPPETPPPVKVEPPVDVGARKAVATASLDSATRGIGSVSGSAAARAVRWLGAWRRKPKPLPGSAKRPGPVKSLGSPSGRTAVQAELSLDKVQVVRNDLSDADYEIVPRNVIENRLPEMSALAAPTKMLPAAGMWDRLTTRIFGAGQT